MAIGGPQGRLVTPWRRRTGANMAIWGGEGVAPVSSAVRVVPSAVYTD